MCPVLAIRYKLVGCKKDEITGAVDRTLTLEMSKVSTVEGSSMIYRPRTNLFERYRFLKWNGSPLGSFPLLPPAEAAGEWTRLASIGIGQGRVALISRAVNRIGSVVDPQ